jgi:hypothetical protein
MDFIALPAFCKGGCRKRMPFVLGCPCDSHSSLFDHFLFANLFESVLNHRFEMEF